MNKKTIINWLGIIVLGAFGSALWESIKPALVWIWTALVSASTLGIGSVRDQMYANAGATLGEPLGIGAGIQLVAAVVFLCTAITINVLGRAVSDPYAHAVRLRAQLLLLSVGTVLVVVASQSLYSLGLALHYKHLTIIAAPNLTEIELKQYQATFSVVKTREQYLAVIGSLVQRIEVAGTKAPSREFL